MCLIALYFEKIVHKYSKLLKLTGVLKKILHMKYKTVINVANGWRENILIAN